MSLPATRARAAAPTAPGVAEARQPLCQGVTALTRRVSPLMVRRTRTSISGPPDGGSAGDERTQLSGPHTEAADVLGRPRLRHPSALRCRNGRRHLPSGDHAAGARTGAVAGSLRAAVPPADRWPLRRKSHAPAALLSV